MEFIPDWKLTAGIRRDEMRSDYVAVARTGTSTMTSTQYSGNFGENSYRVGLSWQPQPDAHYYLGWSDSFSPTADLYQLSGNQYPAERSAVTELGAKWLLLDGDLAFRVALYSAIKDWERNTDLESTASILTRKRRSNGLELELAGRITDEWEVFSGLSLTLVADTAVSGVAGTASGSDSTGNPVQFTVHGVAVQADTSAIVARRTHQHGNDSEGDSTPEVTAGSVSDGQWVVVRGSLIEGTLVVSPPASGSAPGADSIVVNFGTPGNRAAH